MFGFRLELKSLQYLNVRERDELTVAVELLRRRIAAVRWFSAGNGLRGAPLWRGLERYSRTIKVQNKEKKIDRR